MLNSSRKPRATRKAESCLSILCENLPAKSDFLATRKVRVYEYNRSQVVKKGSLEPRGVVTGKLLCSPMYFFSRNRCPYRGVSLPGFLRETRTRICILYCLNIGEVMIGTKIHQRRTNKSRKIGTKFQENRDKNA